MNVSGKIAIMFTVILGPMKSNKSHDLLGRMSPYEFTDLTVVKVQPEANVRDEGIRSRLGINATALAVKSLHEITQPFDVIGIDEVHMFDEQDADVIDTWLHEDKDVIASGLDLDYQGKMMPLIIRLLELKPDNLIQKKSVCEVCKSYDARFTQILRSNVPVLSGLPPVVPEDGTYDYQPRCRGCFVRP
jgi:thymidine kinase